MQEEDDHDEDADDDADDDDDYDGCVKTHVGLGWEGVGGWGDDDDDIVTQTP